MIKNVNLFFIVGLNAVLFFLAGQLHHYIFDVLVFLLLLFLFIYLSRRSTSTPSIFYAQGVLLLLATKILDIELVIHMSYALAIGDFGYIVQFFLLVAAAISAIYIVISLFLQSLRAAQRKNFLCAVILSVFVVGTALAYEVNLLRFTSFGSFLSFIFTTFRLLAVLIPIQVGWNLARKEGVWAALGIASCVPVWINYPTNLTYTLLSKTQQSVANDWIVNAGAFLWTCLPILCFFVIIPISVIRSHSVRNQKLWLLLPAGVTMLALFLIEETINISLSGFDFEATIFVGAIFILSYLPLLLSFPIYEKNAF